LSVLSPHLEILPEAQRRLWPSLVGLAQAGFVLYGGTAIALRYGHRMSVDFDVFHDRPLDRQHLSRELPWLRSAQVLQDQPETLTVLSPAPELENGVKVSFFGGLAIGRVGVPQISVDGVALVASRFDLLAAKLKLLPQRAERKDDQEVAVLLGHGLALAEGPGAAKALDGASFPGRGCLKALVVFADGDLAELGLSERRQLEQAVLAVDAIPGVERIGEQLVPSANLS
jgi:hypothetical protein